MFSKTREKWRREGRTVRTKSHSFFFPSLSLRILTFGAPKLTINAVIKVVSAFESAMALFGEEA